MKEKTDSNTQHSKLRNNNLYLKKIRKTDDINIITHGYMVS